MTDLVQVQDVSKAYRLGATHVDALSHVSLVLAAGEVAALVGPSGSGKSTLLHVIGAIARPDSGQIRWSGQDVADLSERKRSALRNQWIGFVYQTFNLIPVLTVYENVELPMLINPRISRDERKTRTLTALQDVGLEAYASQLPDLLSGGQRQRVAIARALVHGPHLVLADEPTANLDSATAHKIIDLLLELNARRGATLLFSTHDERLIGRVRHVIPIEDGRISS